MEVVFVLYILKNKSGVEAYTRFCRERGMKIGDIKPPVLDVGTGWLARFEGKLFTGKESKK